jgi:hypothetical protein
LKFVCPMMLIILSILSIEGKVIIIWY